MMQAVAEKDYVDVPLVDAAPENIAEYGTLIGASGHKPGLSIPFYAGSVEEGENLDFAYRGRAVVRTARISRRSSELTWLERHLHMSQLFVGLGDQPFVMVLGKPNHDQGAMVPDLENVVAFRLPAGHGIMIHQGTWHDFPMAIEEPVTVLTANSEEVVQALASAPGPQELDAGDVYKINIPQRTGRILRVPF